MPATDPDPLSAIRAHVLDLLRGANAHLDFATALANLPPAFRGAKATGSPHTIWQLVEHLRIAQWDILEFTRDARHPSPKWPEGYWPPREAPANDSEWDESLAAIARDARAFADLVAGSQNSLTDPLPNAPHAQTLLREALVLADHNSYHLGQIVTVRKTLEAAG